MCKTRLEAVDNMLREKGYADDTLPDDLLCFARNFAREADRQQTEIARLQASVDDLQIRFDRYIRASTRSECGAGAKIDRLQAVVDKLQTENTEYKRYLDGDGVESDITLIAELRGILTTALGKLKRLEAEAAGAPRRREVTMGSSIYKPCLTWAMNAPRSEEKCRLCADTAELARLQAVVDEQQTELQIHRDKARGDYWGWQGDEHDHLESLVCPVLIHPRDLRVFTETVDKLRQTISTEVAWLERTEGRIQRVLNMHGSCINAPWIHEEFVVALKSMKAAQAAGGES